MESFKKLAQELLDEITGMLSVVEASTFNALVNSLLAARHVSVAGDGRARYVAAAFVRRLSALGRSASLVGDAASHPAGKGDLLIVVSLRGARGPLTALAEAARKRGARVYSVVGEPSSLLAASSDGVVAVAPQTRTPFEAIAGGGRASLQAFDQAVLIYLDAVLLALQDLLRVAPDDAGEGVD